VGDTGHPPEPEQAPPAAAPQPPRAAAVRADGGADPHAQFFAEPAQAPGEATAVALRVAPDGPVVRLTPGVVLRLGRESSPVARLCSDNVSRHHADIRLVGLRIEIVDTESTNGTFVNDERLPSGVPRQLAAGDTVCLGSDPPLRLDVVPEDVVDVR
jgi:pSer/pThr/pTyr-binding forkhead associated (FHA) protein